MYQNTIANSQTIYFNIAFNSTTCSWYGSFKLIVNPLPNEDPLGYYPQYELCDDVVSNPGREVFNLGSKIQGILNGQLGMQVTFYATVNDAVNNNTSAILPLLYTNAQAFNQTIGIRITNTATGCYVVSSMDLVVNPLPTLVVPPPYIVCDENTDGFTSQFDLNTLTAFIKGGGNYTISYHLTLPNAQANDLPISLTQNFTNNVPFVQDLYVRGIDAKGCVKVIKIELNVNSAPVLPSPPVADLVKCDEDSNNQNGITNFNLEVQTPAILAAQVGPITNYTVSYYESLADATAQSSEIVTTTIYPGVNNQTIWYVVNNSTTTCASAIGSFKLVVNAPIVLTTPTLYSLCDTFAPINNQFAIFNMTNFIGVINGHTITFYLTKAEAEAGTNAIVNPSAYQNTIAANQTVWIAATNNTTGCKGYRTLTLKVLPIPTPKTDPPTLKACDYNNPGDGFELFDLTTNALYIQNNDPNVTLTYYASQAHALAGTPQVANPTAVSLNGSGWIRVSSDVNVGSDTVPCFVIVEQPILINPIPKVANPIADYQQCVPSLLGTTTFDLTSKYGAILLGTSQLAANFTISFYNSQANAQSGTNAIATPTAYPYLNSNTTPEIIYVRIVNNATGCFNASGSFKIKVNIAPTATAPLPYASCDSDNTNDGYLLFPLNTNALLATILGTQLPADYDVLFYTSLANAIADTNAITNVGNYMTNTQTLYIRVRNKATTCLSTVVSFNLTIERKPEPKITTPDGNNVICVDFVTDEIVRGLTLTATNNVAGTYTYQWYENGTLLLGETNSTYIVDADPTGATRIYTVVMKSTSALGCDQESADFPVIQSGQAVIVGPEGYTITNGFEANQIITVNVDGYGAGTYQYSLDDGPRQDSNVFENVSLGSNLNGYTTHTIYVWDTKGGLQYSCDPLEINNVQTIDYPHYFTPNGDGYHDSWNIVGLANQPNAKIYIFDRFGKLIKQISPKGEGWDGTFNGQLLPATDYWFSVNYLEQTIEKQFKAHFSLKR